MFEVKGVMYASIGCVSLSLGLLLCCVPLWLQSVDHLQREIELEMFLVRTASDDMWTDLMAMQGSRRIRRQDYLYQPTAQNYNTVPAYGYGYTKLKCCCSLSGSYSTDYSAHSTSYRCPVGSKGPPGPYGESGESGLDGQPGFNGEDYPSLFQTSIPKLPSDFDDSFTKKEVFCEPCPHGPAGEPGPKGLPGLVGAKGAKGQGGKHGIPGIPGKVGITGDSGARGRPGRSGVAGPNGADGVKGGKGNPGLKGVNGVIGVSGPRGVAGPTGDYGLTGKQGIRGSPGVRGAPGQDGVDGVIGGPGKAGPDGLYCQCPQKTSRFVDYTPIPAPAPVPVPPPAAAYTANETPYKLSDAQPQYVDASFTKKIYNSAGSSNQFTRPGPPGTRPPEGTEVDIVIKRTLIGPDGRKQLRLFPQRQI